MCFAALDNQSRCWYTEVEYCCNKNLKHDSNFETREQGKVDLKENFSENLKSCRLLIEVGFGGTADKGLKCKQ